VTPASGKTAWRVASAASVTLKDGSGTTVSGPLSCSSDDTVKLTVAADCSSVTGLRLGMQSITVSGGGVSAKVSVKVIPQAQPLGVMGATRHFSLAVTSAGEVLAWGYNSQGQLGQNKSGSELNMSALPLKVLAPSGDKPLSGIVAAAGGELFGLALTEDGQVLSWGSNDRNSPELGRPATTGTWKLPDYVADATGTGRLSGIVAIGAGDSNAMALTDDGHVYTWGHYTGQEGGGVKKYPGYVKAPEGGVLADVRSIAAGWNWGGALRSDGRVAVWGFPDMVTRMLQLPSSISEVMPGHVAAAGSTEPLTGLTALSAGYGLGLGLTSSGEVWAFGGNDQGQLGQGTRTAVAGAVRVKTGAAGALLSGQAMVVAGGRHAMSLDAAGRVWSWGLGTDGQLGDGVNRPRGDGTAYPAAVVAETGLLQLENVATLAAGYSHSLALRKDGTLLTWGVGFSGTQGQGPSSSNDLRVPTAVKNGAGDGATTLGAMERWSNLLRRAL